MTLARLHWRILKDCEPSYENFAKLWQWELWRRRNPEFAVTIVDVDGVFPFLEDVVQQTSASVNLTLTANRI